MPLLPLNSQPQMLPRHSAELSGVSLSRGSALLFTQLDLDIQNGDLLWVGGDNGIGKSSLLRLLTGFTPPEAGTLSWRMDGAPCLPSALTAYQGHIDAFKPQLTPREALGFWAQIMDQPDISKALLAQVGLKTRQHIPCGQLSAGQRRRLSLARLMLSSKALWVLDEPTAAMDAEGTSLIAQIIAGHIARGGSAVIASHNAPEITGTRTRRIMLSAKAAA